MELYQSSQTPLRNGKSEYRVEVRFEPEEARRIMSKKDLFAGEGIPLDASVRLAGVQVFIDAPLQIAGLIIADEDTAARFVCNAEQYETVVHELKGYLRGKLAGIWSE
jgi:hypothetical protein